MAILGASHILRELHRTPYPASTFQAAINVHDAMPFQEGFFIRGRYLKLSRRCGSAETEDVI
jgi:hypothetical protein